MKDTILWNPYPIKRHIIAEMYAHEKHSYIIRVSTVYQFVAGMRGHVLTCVSVMVPILDRWGDGNTSIEER